MTVYWTSVEYEYKVKKNLEGGFVFIFVKARDAISAYEIIKEDFASKNLVPISWDFICPFDVNTEWDSEEETLYYKGLYEKALKSKRCVYDNFYAYVK